MSSIREALTQLLVEKAALRGMAHQPLVNAARLCSQLQQSAQNLRQQQSAALERKPKLNVEEVWKKFVASRFDLDSMNGAEFRSLCCGEEIAMRPEFLAALRLRPERLKRVLCLYGLTNSYFAQWRTMPDPEAVEDLLCSAYTQYGSSNAILQRWRSGDRLFSAEGAAWLAGDVCSGQKDVDDVLRTYYVGLTTQLAGAVRGLTAQCACEYLLQNESARGEEWAIQYFQWITDKVLSDLTKRAVFAASISSLIMSNLASHSDRFQSVLRLYIQSHKKLGDPRMRHASANWRDLDPKAAEIYLCWLVRENIKFFFEIILPDNNQNRRRKDFWLRYYHRIIDFQVAVSSSDLWKVKAHSKNAAILLYSQVNHATTSAFLMKVRGERRDYVIVEFSETGNAAYLYKASEFHVNKRTFRNAFFEVKEDLKWDMTERIIHGYEWENKAAAWLSSRFGINQ